MEHTVNLNAAECLKQTNGMLASTYHNVCSGVKIEVPYGAADLLLGYGLGGFVLALFTGMGWVLYKMFKGHI